MADRPASARTDAAIYATLRSIRCPDRRCRGRGRSGVAANQQNRGTQCVVRRCKLFTPRAPRAYFTIMGQYDAQEVCLNGHQTTANYYRYPEFRRSHCATCGAATMHKCPQCGTDIKGDYHVEGVMAIGFEVPVPPFCESCGEPFPWTAKQHRIATELEKGEMADAVTLVEKLCTRFHLVARQIRNRHNGRPTLDVNDEYDVQDLLHTLLVLFFDDVRAEEYTPSYAGKATRMDFLLKRESIVVEAKMTRGGLGAREVGEQLIVDVAHYRTHPSCKVLMCLVYDPNGRIANPRGLENDLSSKKDDFDVRVYVVPKGY
jgi:hypothetical protein